MPAIIVAVVLVVVYLYKVQRCDLEMFAFRSGKFCRALEKESLKDV